MVREKRARLSAGCWPSELRLAGIAASHALHYWSAVQTDSTSTSRFLRIVHIDAERGFSGGEVQVFLLMEGLRALGYWNILICPYGSAAAAEASRRGIEHYTVEMRNEMDVSAVRSLTRGLRMLGPDLVHLHTSRAVWLGGLAAWFAGVPAVATCRMERRFRRGWRTRFIFRSLIRHSVSISTSIDASLAAADVPAERRSVIPSAVDLRRCQLGRPVEEVRADLGVAPGEMVLLAAAALVERKGIDVLIDAMALLAERNGFIKLWVAGDGPARAALQTQAARAGLSGRVRFLGHRADMGDLLSACDIFVMPSRKEGLGVAALEAMAAGKPVVASAVGGLQEALVDERCGLLVPPGDASALASALSRLLEDRALLERLGRAGPKRVAERYSAERMVASYDRLYRAVLEEWKNGQASRA